MLAVCDLEAHLFGELANNQRLFRMSLVGSTVVKPLSDHLHYIDVEEQTRRLLLGQLDQLGDLSFWSDLDIHSEFFDVAGDLIDVLDEAQHGAGLLHPIGAKSLDHTRLGSRPRRGFSS